MNLIWFRTDLRVHDNMALNAALEKGSVVGLYIATPKQWQDHDDAPIKIDFWRRNLEALKQSLSELNIPLIFFQVPDYKAVPEVIRGILSTGQVESLQFNAEYPLNEARRDASVITLAEDHGLYARVYHDQVLLEPGSVLNKSGSHFKVFTPFSKKCREMIYVPEQFQIPSQSSSLLKTLAFIPRQVEISDIDWPEPNAGWEALWPAGENTAKEKLEDFSNNAVSRYKQDRDFPAIEGTSTLGPWLNAGVISIRECWRHATCMHSGEGPETWKNELLWREFYRHIVHHAPHVSMKKAFRQELDNIPWRHNQNEFKQWCEGNTGIPIIDAAMRQLLETGWMHNRLRMITAMFLSKHLLIDWRWGEKWFMTHLIDGDFSANNGGWQWSASTGTDAAPYFRIFNPVTQSRRFDESGNFIRRFVKELSSLESKSVHDPGLLKPESYPVPLVDLKFGRERALAAFKN
jgi:deoxyribodipyrimidine photo-lyase